MNFYVTCLEDLFGSVPENLRNDFDSVNRRISNGRKGPDTLTYVKRALGADFVRYDKESCTLTLTFERSAKKCLFSNEKPQRYSFSWLENKAAEKGVCCETSSIVRRVKSDIIKFDLNNETTVGFLLPILSDSAKLMLPNASEVTPKSARRKVSQHPNHQPCTF